MGFYGSSVLESISVGSVRGWQREHKGENVVTKVWKTTGKNLENYTKTPKKVLMKPEGFPIIVLEVTMLSNSRKDSSVWNLGKSCGEELGKPWT